jgi:hypothetical protein
VKKVTSGKQLLTNGQVNHWTISRSEGCRRRGVKGAEQRKKEEDRRLYEKRRRAPREGCEDEQASLVARPARSTRVEWVAGEEGRTRSGEDLPASSGSKKTVSDAPAPPPSTPASMSEKVDSSKN